MNCSVHLSALTELEKSPSSILLSQPTSFTKIFKDECVLCFKNINDGICICLDCYHGGCQEHASLHFRKYGHVLGLHLIKKTFKDELNNTEMPKKLMGVEILTEEEVGYGYSASIKCQNCNHFWDIEDPAVHFLSPLVDAILNLDSAKRKIEILNWREERTSCQHILSLNALPNVVLPVSDCCNDCKLADGNLWMCLVCGNVGCGRRQFDGSGGNGHGALHFEQTSHACAVKLGTISSDGNADVNCYVCDELRNDLNLAAHLSKFGIDLNTTQKTCKSLDELQLEQNVVFNFSLSSSDERKYPTIDEVVGITNMGNSCYLAAAIQILMAIPDIRNMYGETESEIHHSLCKKDPSLCFSCQFGKLVSGLNRRGLGNSMKSVSPWMFKAVIGAGHPSFMSNDQQDASEFLVHFLRMIQRSDPLRAPLLLSQLEFQIVEIISCIDCGFKRKQIVKSTILQTDLATTVQSSSFSSDKCTLDECISHAFQPCQVDLCCPACSCKKATKTQRILNESLPNHIFILLSRFVVSNWIPRKLEMFVESSKSIDLQSFLIEASEANGISFNASFSARIVPDQDVIKRLLEMGFAFDQSVKAIEATNNTGFENALNWIFENSLANAQESSPFATVDDSKLSLLTDAGFSLDFAVQALSSAQGDIERAFDRLISDAAAKTNDAHMTGNSRLPHATDVPLKSSYKLVGFISHKGPSMHCGHYVAARFDHEHSKWILCDDSKVLEISENDVCELAAQAYIFLYSKEKSF